MWDETKANFLSDVVSMIAYFDTNEAVQNDKSLVFKEMLLAFQTVLRAASKQRGVARQIFGAPSNCLRMLTVAVAFPKA